MSTQGYGKHIQLQIQGWLAGEPITTAAVAATLTAAYGIDRNSAKKITNVNMKRLADKGELARIQKGVYGKIEATPFGNVMPSTDELIAELLLRDGEKTVGYITGPSVLNAVGLCNWMPKERHIATNHYRRRLPAGARIRVYKPATTIDGKNALYLQTIEVCGHGSIPH